MSEMPTKYRKSLSAEEKERFAYELALGYFEPEELRHQFKLLPEGFNQYMVSDEIKTLTAAKRREIDESDAALRIHARRAARIAIDELANLVKDKEAPAKTRMEAGRQLREYATVADKKVLDDPNAGEGAVIIKTNLDMKSARGVYTITSEEIQEQVAENLALATSDDFGDLLGV